MTKKKLWTSPGGATPDATLYASILRDLKKGNDARFKKAAPGKFSLAKIQIMAHLDELMTRLSEANREKLAFAIRQTVKRITLRRERRGDGKHRITHWDGAIELRDELGTNATLALTDDDIPSPGRWRDVQLAGVRRQRPLTSILICWQSPRSGRKTRALRLASRLSSRVWRNWTPNPTIPMT